MSDSSSSLSAASITCGCSPLRIIAVYEEVVPAIIPCSEKTRCAKAILSMREFVRSISTKALCRLERRQGSFTAFICFDSVMEEHKPLTWQRYVETDTTLNKNVMVMVKTCKRVLNRMEHITCKDITAYEITEVHKRCKTFDHFRWDMASNCCEIHLIMI
jgi:hypothetical protein